MPNQIQTNDTLRLIQCTVGDETYGLNMSWVRNIQRADRLRPVSRAEVDTAGLIGWLPGLESDIPIFSLANRLGLTDRSAQSTSPAGDGALQRIIVLPSPLPPADPTEQREQLWALLVDQVSPVIQIPSANFYPLPAIVADPATNYFEGIISLEEALVLLLSPAWLHPQESNSESDFEEVSHHIAGSPQMPTTNRPNPANLTPKTQNPKSSARRIMVFSTSSEDQVYSFGLSITQIPEVLRPRPLTPVPTAPPFVLGLVNWRDRPVPIIDLDARLGLAPQTKPTANRHTRLIIARGVDQDTFVGFAIQAGVRVLRLPLPHQPISNPLPLDQTLVKGAFDIEGKTLVLPDIQNIMAVGEQ